MKTFWMGLLLVAGGALMAGNAHAGTANAAGKTVKRDLRIQGGHVMDQQHGFCGGS